MAMITAGLRSRFVARRDGAMSVTASIDIEPGGIVALLGPNGAGKSTAVAAIAGLLPIDEGRIELGEVVLDDPKRGLYVPPEQRGIGVVFQDHLLFPHMNVLENVAFGPRSQGVQRRDAHARAREWLERISLSDIEDRKPDQLSGGEAQRVALARALATDPGLLLLDEPLSALDVTARARMRTVLSAHLREYGGPTLLITHDPVEAFLIADRVAVIEEGTITQTGTPDELRLRPRTTYAADLAGVNLVTGTAHAGVVDTDGGRVTIADSSLSGPVLLTIRPAAIAVHVREPEGSPRNSWETLVVSLENLGDRVRIGTGAPQPLTAEVTGAAVAELGLQPGSRVWISVKATEIGVEQVG